MHVRVCRECGEEYRPEVARCADCGGELEDRWEGEDGSGGSAPRFDNPAPGVVPALDHGPMSAESAVVFSGATAADVEPVAKALGGSGVPFNVTGSFSAFAVRVAEADLQRALEVLTPLIGAPPEPPSETGPAACPACGAALAPNAHECAECGLGLHAAAGGVCPRCGRELPESGECPTCRAAE